MRFSRPFPLKELARLAEERIRDRLAFLGSPDLPFEVRLVGDGDTAVQAICPIEALEAGCLTFAVSRSILARAEESEAAALILPPDLSSSVKPYLSAPIPRLVFSVLLELTQAEPSLVPGLETHVRFKDRSRVSIGENTVIGDWCYIGRDVSIGRNCRVYPQVFIDDDVTLGDGCVVYPRVTLFRNTRVGRHVIIHSGAVIGDDGFGYNQVPDEAQGRLLHVKNEHVGHVVLEDHVEVGSAVCIDRGLAGPTIVGAGTKIDNITQIGHNVRIGRDCIVVNASFAGRVRLGDRVFAMGARISDGNTIGDDALLLAGALVIQDIPPGRNRWLGFPAQDADREFKTVALSRRELPRLRRFFQLLKKAGSFQELKELFFETSAKNSSQTEE